MVAAEQSHKKIYQDRYIGGQVVAAGTRESGDRYAAIVEVLGRGPASPTVVDIGANQGYFSFRLAEDLGALCVMIEKQADLAENCIRHGADNLILLQRAISARELRWLAQREHFDAVLCLNVLHHFGWRWRSAMRAVLALGDRLFVENPPNNDSGSRGRYIRAPINRRLETIAHEVLCETSRRRDRPIASRLVLLEGQPGREPDTHARRPPGLGLRAYQRLGGVYPLIADLRRAIEELADERREGLAIDDLVVQGRRVAALERSRPASRAEIRELHDWLATA